MRVVAAPIAAPIAAPAVVCACLLGAGGCSGDDRLEVVLPPAQDASGGDAARSPDAIRFTEPFLALLPGTSREVGVEVSPAGAYPLRLSLSETSSDASLDRSEVVTAADGRASFVLSAPSQPAVFAVTATGGDTATALPVSVSGAGFATLDIVPIYDGKRDVPYWAASVHAGATCSTLGSLPPPDGPLLGESLTGNPRIEGVPIGPSLAVTVRAAWAIGGCKDAPGLVADSLATIEISASDVPLALAETDLVLGLGVGASRPWEEAASAVGAAIESALLGGAEDDVEALLDSMQLALPTPTARAGFATNRAEGQWDDALRGALGASAGSAIRAAAADWISAGAARLSGPGVLEGRLTAEGSTFVLGLGPLLGVPAEDAGLPARVDEAVSWTSEPGDTVLLGATFAWCPSRLFGAVAVDPAKQAVAGAEDVPTALAIVVDCAGVGAALEALATGDVAPGCATGCAEALCVEAVAAMWSRALAATPDGSATWTLGATATTRVDERARPSGFEGTWVGTLAVGALVVDVGGELSASTPPG
ncbi:MAG: hypothetical protein IT376_21485 [Polyangiaceae bacterium]|nr:hypothetical protein [Polyangiaceae bacterium]